MDTSIFAFATDLADEGIETVLDNVEHRGGLGGVTVAAAYHEGRDVFPHNPVRRVRFLESGAVFFPPGPALRAVRMQPPVSEAADVLPEAIAAAGRRGLAVRAWTVFLHNGALAAAHPECAPENAFGDRYITELCPAHPDARAYARALAADIAALGVAGISSEALHYLGVEHGYAHERYFVPLGARVRYLLGLCFCEHCLAAARATGVDGEAVRRDAREAIEHAFAGKDPGGEPERDEYARVREQVVTSLVAEVAEAAGETPLEFIELSGAVKGYADGRPTGDPSPSIAWQLGVDVAAVAAACDGIEAMGYAADRSWIERDLDTYGDDAVSVIFRPSTPDCDSAEALRAKVDLARDRALGRVDFYHYGLMRLDALDWIHDALTRADEGVP
jgi:hydrogenase/urease accessory protein HupE